MLPATSIHGHYLQREREYLVGWQRAQADLANFRRRTHEQRAAESALLRHQVAQPLLTLADHLRTAAAALPVDLAEHSWAQGVLHIARQLDAVLGELGLTIISEVGVPFDPRHHEALSEQASPVHAAGTVVTVHQPGYRIGDHVIRPAKVTVAR